MKNKTYNRKKTIVVFFCAVLLISALFGRLVYLMIFDAAHYQKLAKDLHERERKIKAARGEIIDRNGVVLATNRTVCTISVIHNQIKDPEQVIAALCQELGEEEENIRKWDRILGRMEFLFREANEDMCRKKNPYEKEHDLAQEEFTTKYGMFGEKLKTEEEIAREKREHTHRLYMMSDVPEYVEISGKWLAAEGELREYRDQCLKQGMELMTSIFGTCGIDMQGRTKRKRWGIEGGFRAASVMGFLFLPVICLAVRHGPRCRVQDAPGGTLGGMVRFLCFLTLFADRDK